MQQPYLTYLLTNAERDAFYAGVSRDLEFSVMAHKRGFADSFTKTHDIFQLVWWRPHNSLISALRDKGKINSMSLRRITGLIERDNPEWRELPPSPADQVA